MADPERKMEGPLRIPQEAFQALLGVTSGTPLRVDRFRYNPKGTAGISVEILVSFAWGEAPAVAAVTVTGLNVVGFTMGSEYRVKAYVDEWTVETCKKENCVNAIRFKIKVKFFVSLVIGITFGFGWGPGTAGWQTASLEQTAEFTTRCICCDDLVKMMSDEKPQPGG